VDLLQGADPLEHGVGDRSMPDGVEMDAVDFAVARDSAQVEQLKADRRRQRRKVLRELLCTRGA
jgi:hypothetical protein